MTKLWQQRLQRQQRLMLRYLRLVFNEFFMIAVFILLGGAAYSYAGYIKTLTAPLWWSRPLVLILLLVLLTVGHFATLLQAADSLFLLPQESALKGYLKQAFSHSVPLPWVLLSFVCGFLVPFLEIGGGRSLISIGVLWLSVLILKLGQLWGQVVQLYLPTTQFRSQQVTFYGLSLLSLGLGLYSWPALGFVFSILTVSISRWRLQQVQQQHLFQWQLALNQEASRMLQIYRFFNLFTDVPQLQGQIKRRRYLQPLLRWTTGRTTNPFLYLNWRGFLRGTEYSGLYLRLLVIGAIVLLFLQQVWLALVIALVFSYLIGFQLLPFYRSYWDYPQQRLYPQPASRRQQAFLKFLTPLFVGIWLVFSLAAYQLWLAPFGWVIILGVGVFNVAFLKLYVPNWLKRHEN